MMLTELYYYYGNHPAAKAVSRLAFSFSLTAEKAARTTAVISASALRRNRETALESELSLDSESRNKVTGTATKKRDGPRLRNAKAAPNPTTE